MALFYYHDDVRTIVPFFCFLLAIQADEGLDALARVHLFREVAMSADGGMVAWIETIPAKDGGDSSRAALFVKDLKDANATARVVMDEGETVQGLAWSHEGKLAFIANAGDEKQLQLYISEKPGHAKPRKVTNVKGFLADPHWSPDGSNVALLWMEGVTHIPGPT